MCCKWLVGLGIALAAVAPASAQTVRAGIEAWQKADYAGAVAIWRPIAEKGDADAAFNLGQAYRLGRGVQMNLGAAQTWFERAARSGHLDAQTTLGLMLFQNGNESGGLRWLRQAAEKGEPRALLIYGTALYNGDGTPRDPVLGYAYVSRAAAQGLEAARGTLEQMDQALPLEVRKQGLAIAMSKAKEATAPASKKIVPAKKIAKPSKPVEEPSAAATAAPAKAPTPAKAPAPAKTPAPAKAPAPAAANASGNWRIQLGAFSQRGSAEALYKKVSGNSALSGRRPYYVPAGAVTRLQVGPFETKAAAASACRSLGEACFPVPAK